MSLRLASRFRRYHSRQAFGLDIGARSVKVLELRRVGSAYAVARCAVVALPGGAVAEGTIHEPARVAETIRVAVSVAGIPSTAAIIGLCGRGVIVKKVQIPEVPRTDLSDAVRIEAEHEIPFAIDEVSLAFHVIGRQSRMVDLALVAARRSKVMEHRAVATEAGLDPAVVDVDGFALGNQSELYVGPGVNMVVDIGATLTKMSVVKDGLTQLVRDLPSGGDACTAAIASRLGIAVDAAEAIKINPDRARDAVAAACEAMAHTLGLEIQRTLDYFAAGALSPQPVTAIALVGGGAKLAGLREHLASILNLRIDLADPCAGLAVDPACAATVAGAGPALALALGLSLRRPGDETHT